MVANLLEGIEVRLSTDYLENKDELDAMAEKVVYTVRSMHILIISLVHWNIVPCVLKQKLWINRISREMQL